MRKTLNINLGGIAFIIDENAFEILHNYLEALKRKFNNEAERAEIMADIESRIAEMLSQKLAGSKEVISIEDVQPVIDMMGRPEDIAGEETAEATGTTNTTSSTTTTSTTFSAPVKKRLFRDPDDAKVGGVISGLCHYFGITDPVWARIAAIVLIFLTSGSIILLYLLLVIVVPKAYTAAEKLQMKGEPVNINTIEKEIKDAANRAGESVHSMFKNDNFFEKLLHVFVTIASVFLKIIAGIIIFFGLLMLIALIATVTGVSIAGNSFFTQAPHLFIDSPQTVTLFNIGLALAIGAPIVGALYAALRLLTGSRVRTGPFKWVLLVLWLIGVGLLATVGIRTISEFKANGVKKDAYTLMQPTTGNLYVQLVDSAGNKVSPDEENEESFNIDFNGVYINGEDLKNIQMLNIGKPSLQITASTNDSFTITKIVSSQGRTKSEAVNNAGKVIYSISQRDSVLSLPYGILLDKTSKWRNQSMKIVIAIPEGRRIHFADNIDLLHEAIVKGDNTYNDTYFDNTTWTVEKGTVKCIVGENHYNAEPNDSTALNEKWKKSTRVSVGGDHKKNNDDNSDDKDDEKEKDF